jgi:hypothetical protein
MHIRKRTDDTTVAPNVIGWPGRIEQVPTKPPAELLGSLQGRNTFQREDDRLCAPQGDHSAQDQRRDHRHGLQLLR